MPSFDVVSEVPHDEMLNAVDQTLREISRRFDLKDTKATIEYDGKQEIILIGNDEFQANQVKGIFQTRLTARSLDLKILKEDKTELNLSEARLFFIIQEGIESTHSKGITKLIKGSKLKVQSSINDGKIRVTAKKRDDLQSVIDMLKEHNFDIPLQFNNFRD